MFVTFIKIYFQKNYEFKKKKSRPKNLHLMHGKCMFKPLQAQNIQ